MKLDILFVLDKRILHALFYLLDKDSYTGSLEENVLIQNMVCFLQQHVNWIHSEFTFVLTEKGMYSPGFERFLYDLAIKKEMVKNYMVNNGVDEISLRDWKVLNSFRDRYCIDNHIDNIEDWVKAVACVSYVKEVVLPGCPYKEVRERILRDVSGLPDKILKDAWDTVS